MEPLLHVLSLTAILHVSKIIQWPSAENLLQCNTSHKWEYGLSSEILIKNCRNSIGHLCLIYFNHYPSFGKRQEQSCRPNSFIYYKAILRETIFIIKIIKHRIWGIGNRVVTSHTGYYIQAVYKMFKKRGTSYDIIHISPGRLIIWTRECRASPFRNLCVSSKGHGFLYNLFPWFFLCIIIFN